MQTAQLPSKSQMERFKQSYQPKSLCKHLREWQIRLGRRHNQRVRKSLTNVLIARGASIQIVHLVDTLRRLTLVRAKITDKNSRNGKTVKRSGFRSRLRRSSLRSSQLSDHISSQRIRGEQRLLRSLISYLSSTYKTWTDLRQKTSQMHGLRVWKKACCSNFQDSKSDLAKSAATI